MKRWLMMVAALALAGCGEDGTNPMAAVDAAPARNGSGLPNLYVQSIVHNSDPHHPSVTVTVCNNGTALAWFTRTFVSHWAGLYHEGYDIDHPIIYAGTCSSNTRDVYPGLSGVTHSYFVYADDYWEVTESNENDNNAQLQGVS